MLGLGTGEILAIVVVLFLLFGASRLPQLAKSLGQTRKAFKEGMREAEAEEQVEKEQRRLNPTAPLAAPQISAITDDELTAEMRRRAQVKQS